MGNGNFTGEIKRELIRNGLENACCKTAALAAFLRTTGSIVYSGGALGFEFVTESETVAEYFIGLAEEMFGADLKIVHAGTDSKNGRGRLVFSCVSAYSAYILEELAIAVRGEGGVTVSFGIDPYLLENDCCARAFVMGAFCGAGSCILPNEAGQSTGYHLEIAFTHEDLAEQFVSLLAVNNLLAKTVRRRNHCIVYMKSVDSISDFLSFLGAGKALKKLGAVAVRREERNNINRAANCLQKNYDRAVLASVRQVRAIEKIEQEGRMGELDEALAETAKARMENKVATLAELAAKLGVSKSCLSYRFRKLIAMADETKKGGKDDKDGF